MHCPTKRYKLDIFVITIVIIIGSKWNTWTRNWQPQKMNQGKHCVNQSMMSHAWLWYTSQVIPTPNLNWRGGGGGGSLDTSTWLSWLSTNVLRHFLAETRRYIDRGRHLEKQRKVLREEGVKRGKGGETSSFKSFFDSSQLSGSINVQDGGTTSFPKTN